MKPLRSEARFLRRYPALGLVAAAAILALMLPSALNVPLDGPQSLAEFAPVPGQGEGRSDASGLGSAEGGGLPFGRGSAAPVQPESQRQLIQRRSSLKRCVGQPKRQTEDPLSPPCVPFFEGDNGGSTWRGVSGDEVIAVLHMAKLGRTGRPTTLDCAEPPTSEDTYSELGCKAYMRYFNQRYQTYGRSVHLYISRNGEGANLAGEVEELDLRFKPFALTSPDDSQPSIREAIRRGMLTVSYPGWARKEYADQAPLRWGYTPDWEDEAAIFAGYVCRKLAGRVARYSGNPADVTRTRKFAVVWQASAARRDTFVSALRDCGVEPVILENYGRPTVVSLQEQGVTSVIPVTLNEAALSWTVQGEANNYRPEWVLPAWNDTRKAQDYHQAQWANAFGIMLDRRRDRVVEQHWYQAYREACPECPEPVQDSVSRYRPLSEAYENFLVLFHGIQAAGPKLTPASFDKGMHAIPARSSVTPYAPAAYFTANNYTYTKDATAIWWDPLGTAPGSSRPGCYRLPHEGARFRRDEWRPTDDDVQAPGPCQGPRE